ncbi:MAG: Eco57I restriction-modification methylase domain-containing protein, partial [Pyrinomonadaceae bacterium]
SNLSYGILTNGKLWRLIPRELKLQQRRFETYLEFNLARVLDAWLDSPNLTEQSHLIDEFLYFYLFFSPVAHREVAERRSLIVRAIDGSTEYRIGVGDRLKDNAFEALRLCIEGFLAWPSNGLDSTRDLQAVREQSFILLYRLLFTMYAEDRQLLPYKVNRTYTINRSLGRLRDNVASRLDNIRLKRELGYSSNEATIWAYLRELFDLVDRGHKTYGVPAYNGGLFDGEAHLFLTTNKIFDLYMAPIIDEIGRAFDPLHSHLGRSRVDYHDLSIQHLGSIYEGLLELQPHHASEMMVVISRRVQGRAEEKVQPLNKAIEAGFNVTAIKYPPGSVYLLTDKGERRATGSYYTPDHIVDYIVENTLGPLCNAVSGQLTKEIAETEELFKAGIGDEREELGKQLASLSADFDDRILRLRVLDPAMGSGHFLLRACQYLAEEIATNPYTQDDEGDQLHGDESALTFWKRKVVEHCLYGVDMNPLAVELAKLALWLETVAADRPLTFLDHHLRRGNSLIGAKVANLGLLHNEFGMISREFITQLEDQLHALLNPLIVIRDASSDTTEQVKAKQKLLDVFERAREPFRALADLWTANVIDLKSELTSEHYQGAVALVSNAKEFRKIEKENWFQNTRTIASRSDVECFHWELEFPEVFFAEVGRRSTPGFEAIIGNPPYDVLSEKESHRDLSALRAFIAADNTYEPSRRGKNNLYKLFICRALDVLTEGGRFGFITPMAVLGDDQAADIRRRIVEVGAFTGIEAFPQKDDPTNRIFPEAKLSTAVFTMIKERSPETSSRPFTARVHPGKLIDAASPSLQLTTQSIPLYDPQNFTIVSCSQDDWDLATRIMRTGRMKRLRESVEFFQGEVNETNERAKGNLTDDTHKGKLVTRGASICLYVTRQASQGEDLLLDVEKFLADKGAETKAFHHRFARIGVQESCPQNNFRRIIAAYIPSGDFCNHKINYVPEHKIEFPIYFLLALLNSKISDWYFRLGSTNAAVSHYQLYNLPCPNFASSGGNSEKTLEDDAIDALNRGNLSLVFRLLEPMLGKHPYSIVVRKVISEAAKKIINLEVERGDIPRSARSALDPKAQPYQDLIDRLFYAMAALTETEASAIEDRLSRML